jgi:hypothetical protein
MTSLVDYACLMAPVALKLLGHPQQKHGSEWHYNNSSLIVNVEMGTWVNRQTSKRGGVPELVRLRRYDHAIWLRSQGLVDASGNPTPPPRADSQPEPLPPPPHLQAEGEPVPKPEPVPEAEFSDDIVNDAEADDPFAAPGWREAAVEYHKERGNRVSIVSHSPERLAGLRKLMDDDVSLDRAAHKLHGRGRGAAASTIEALMHSLRRGAQELGKPATQRRLAALTESQLEVVCDRVQNFKPKIAPAWSSVDVNLLVSEWNKCHD